MYVDAGPVGVELNITNCQVTSLLGSCPTGIHEAQQSLVPQAYFRPGVGKLKEDLDLVPREGAPAFLGSFLPRHFKDAVPESCRRIKVPVLRIHGECSNGRKPLVTG